MKIYLDDLRACPDGWTLVKSYAEFRDLLKQCIRQCIDIKSISFDHDLHGSHYGVQQWIWKDEPSPEWLDVPTGYDACMLFIVQAQENDLPFCLLSCHSSNTQGAMNIKQLIHQYNHTTV